MDWDDVRAVVCGVLLIGLIVFATSGVTVNGKHYGVRGCDSERGIVFDMGEPTKGSE